MQDASQNPLARVMSIMANQSVQEELDVLGPQLQNFKSSFDELKDDVVGRIEELQRKSSAEKRKQRPKLLEEVNSEVQQMLSEVLLPEQLERFKQLRLQKDGLAAFTDDSVRSVLDFKEDQLEGLRQIVMPGMKRVNAAMKTGSDPLGKSVREIHAEEIAKVVELMTDEQRARWQELIGDEFAFDDEPPAGATAGGPGARGPGQGGPSAL